MTQTTTKSHPLGYIRTDSEDARVWLECQTAYRYKVGHRFYAVHSAPPAFYWNGTFQVEEMRLEE